MNVHFPVTHQFFSLPPYPPPQVLTDAETGRTLLMAEVLAYPGEEGEVVLRLVSGAFKGKEERKEGGEGGREGGREGGEVTIIETCTNGNLERQ